MSDLGSRRALILASSFAAAVFAVAVFSLAFVGEGPGALPSFLLFVVGPLIALYFIVKSAVGAVAVAANTVAATPQLRMAREIPNARYTSGEIGREDYEEDYEEMRGRLETS